LPIDASDEGILRWVREWVGLLAGERYGEAYNALYHLRWNQMTPEAMEFIRRYGTVAEELGQRDDVFEPTPAPDITPRLMEQLVRDYGVVPGGDRERRTVYKVTPIEEAASPDHPLHQDEGVQRSEPRETLDGSIVGGWSSTCHSTANGAI
jgi:hypothetical protein